jgi:YggT family protein
MIPVLAALTAFSSLLRSALLGAGIAFTALAAVDWAVRTRRLNPFGGPARFLRSRVDPRLAGIERQVLRAGGHPSATPWWALVAYVVVAALLIAAVDMLAGLVGEAALASNMGAMGIVLLLVRWSFAFFRVALLVRVIGTWFPRAAASRWLRWSYPATEWMLRPLRRVIPTIGVIDITPIVAYFALQIAEGLITRVLFPGFA